MDVVTKVKVVKAYVLDVSFADGERRRIDVEALLNGEMFEPLRDPAVFSRAVVDPVLGTVVWPNGADFSPEFLRRAPETKSDRASARKERTS